MNAVAVDVNVAELFIQFPYCRKIPFSVNSFVYFQPVIWIGVIKGKKNRLSVNSGFADICETNNKLSLSLEVQLGKRPLAHFCIK